MAIPDYQSLFRPLLEAASDGKEHSIKELRERVAKKLGLSEKDLQERLKSGQSTFYNRLGWARTYLVKAGALESTRRGYVKITERGKELLKKDHLRTEDLMAFDEFKAFLDFSKTKNAIAPTLPTPQKTPEEILEEAYEKIRQELASQLLERILSNSPAFFEKLIVDLMLAMGYGGSDEKAAKVLGKTKDGGIDGVINEDKLGLDTIYLQAKRYLGSVGRPQVQGFVGAMQGRGAKKGVFITTGTFTADAKRYAVALSDPKVILIDGEELAKLMIDHGVGTTTLIKYEIKRIDSDYFEE
jgi:restriction system protein